MSASLYPHLWRSQNFLKDPHLVASLLDGSGMDQSSTVYEIGAGKGIITEQLALRYKEVVAIEKDPAMAALLHRRFANSPNVTIHCGDFLRYPVPHRPYNVFANIPFDITAAIVARLTATPCPPQDAYLVMQKEAAAMFLGEPHESLRAILLKPEFEMEIFHRFRRGDFLPAPRVDVVMLRLRKRGPPLLNIAERQGFRDFAVHIFTSWQPTLDHTLKSIFTNRQLKYIQRDLGIRLDATPTSVPFEQWLTLFRYFRTLNNEHAMRLIAGSEQCLTRRQQSLQKCHRTRSRR